MNKKVHIKNRGSLTNPEGRFETLKHADSDDGWTTTDEDEQLPVLETFLYPEQGKTIITRNDSPDIGFDQSINPYKGCEHGCVYCYARPSHAYMNLSPGLDFETKIFYKVDAAKLLEKEICRPKYICQPIVIGANTDPYQPAERKLKVTRSIIEILHKYSHPFSIITKNAMIERDMDLLSDMAKKNLVKVAISVTSLDLQLKQILEPRTSSPKARLRAIHTLSTAKVPVRVMAAPMIPQINDHELEKILAAAYEAGALQASYTLVRLPYEVKDLFKEWLNQHFPQRAQHVMSIIRQMRGGKEYDSTFGVRMTGEGIFADLLENRFRVACKKIGLNSKPTAPFDITLFDKNAGSGQLDLF